MKHETMTPPPNRASLVSLGCGRMLEWVLLQIYMALAVSKRFTNIVSRFN